MTVFCLGSINADHVYGVPHLPVPGETLAARTYAKGLGGKGANQSVAVAQSGGKVFHIGAVGPDGTWLLEDLSRYGVDLSYVKQSDGPSGHAIINVDDAAENAIVIFAGANQSLECAHIQRALKNGKPGDWLLAQNETNLVPEASQAAQTAGMNVAYSAAPFEAEAALAVLNHVTLLLLNEGEAQGLAESLGVAPEEIPVPRLVITKGKSGAEYIDRDAGTRISVPAFDVAPVDTTGAGDTFAGYLVAALDAGIPEEEALIRASAAAALQVTRKGAATAIPTADEVTRFLADR